ncbi:MAG: diaminopimelate epimerase [Mycobacterium sp.]
MAKLELTKHHGLGNDFLILLDLEDRFALSVEMVRRICDRHRGVGADGLIRALPATAGPVARMELSNSDGSRAEMSGNGIRCLAQALAAAGLSTASEFQIETLAGTRGVSLRPGAAPEAVEVAVSMGAVEVSAFTDGELPGTEACRVSVGNPHLVLLLSEKGSADRVDRADRVDGVELSNTAGQIGGVDLRALGPVIESGFPGGINVEVVVPGPGEGEVSIGIWERGAGLTLGSGTGSTAAAAAARHWGLAGDRVLVNNPGGRLEVDLSGPEAIMTGEAVFIAKVEVPIT